MTEQQYIDLFQKHRHEIDANSSEGINNARDAAFEAFKKIGFPSSKDEDYKHSNIMRVFDGNFGLNLRNVPIAVNPYDVFKCDVPDLKTHLHFLINERYYDKIKPTESLPKGVFAGSMCLFSEKYPEIFQRFYARIADYSDNGTAAYNTMFAQDGFVLYIPENKVIESPIQVINILRGGADMNVNRRFLIIAEKNAQAKLLICDHTVDDVHFVVTQVTEVFADADSQVDIYELEENSEKVSRVNSFFSQQKENSSVIATGITLHNGYTRNNYNVKILGKHAEAHVGGLAICDKAQHVDNFAYLDHALPNCTSNQLFKTILDERATGVFCGKIMVEKDAQKTQAYQTNRNLCVSNNAQMFAKPQLEIYADDVKCSHGLTTGHLDEEALFYMRARGIDKDEARLLLMVAFTRDVIDMIRIDSLQERMEYLIDKRFRGNLLRCGNCEVCK